MYITFNQVGASSSTLLSLANTDTPTVPSSGASWKLMNTCAYFFKITYKSHPQPTMQKKNT